MAKNIILYGRKQCELCDQAETMLQGLDASDKWHLVKIDIDSDDRLLEQFGWSIPVLQREDNAAQLKWPFPASRLREFLND